jgi:hypothetical protein
MYNSREKNQAARGFAESIQHADRGALAENGGVVRCKRA